MATDTLIAQISNFMPQGSREILYKTLGRIVGCHNSVSMRPAGLVIKSGGSTLAKTGSAAWIGTAHGKGQRIAGGTDMPALTGLVITANFYNVVAFVIDEFGVVTAVYGTQASTFAAVKWPERPARKCVIGYLVITHSATFTGGTTPLDTATTDYCDALGSHDPTYLGTS